jgi:hypothetical protein
MPSLQQESQPQLLVQVSQLDVQPQVSQLLQEWNRLKSRFRPDSQPQSQLVVQLLQLGAAQDEQVSQPQLEWRKRFNSFFRQPSSQQVSQHEPQPPPQHELAAGAGAAGATFAAGAPGSAPASQAVVISTNAAFTSYPPNESDVGARRAWPRRFAAVGRPRTSTILNSTDFTTGSIPGPHPGGRGSLTSALLIRLPGPPRLSSFPSNPRSPLFPPFRPLPLFQFSPSPRAIRHGEIA